jgi:K+-transporting ATPase KdpF subunit
MKQGSAARRSGRLPAGENYAGPGHGRHHDCLLRDGDRLRLFLRARAVRETKMEAIVMLAVSALMMVYLLYALLYPERF